MSAARLPTLKFLRECFTICPTARSGLVWKVRPRNHFNTNQGWKSTNGNYANKAAGNLWTDYRDPKSQYWTVMIQGVTFPVHRIIYSLAHNVKMSIRIEIDHIDTNGLNNCVENLRLADGFSNRHNVNKNRRNTSGYKGVMYHNGWKAWYGRVCFHGARYRTTPYPTPEGADEAVRKLRETLHREFTNHG